MDGGWKMPDEDRSYIPYYYGLNYEAPPGVGNPGAFPSAGLGMLAGRAMRQSVVGGSDAGLWYERLAGVPLEPQRMGLNFGNETEGQELWGEAPKSEWTSYRTLPEAVGELAGVWKERIVDPVVRTGDVLRGRNPYGVVDEINDIRTVARAMGVDVLGAVGAAATPGMFGSRVRPSTVSGLGYKDQLLAERQAMINKVKGIQGDYDQMIAESAKITGLPPASLYNKVQSRFQTAYDAAREKSGASFVDIAVLRDNLGLSQEKMAGMLRKASREGHAVLELGERSVVDDYLKGGAVDGKLLVRLDPEFFENIGTYIKPEVRQSLQQMEVDEIEKELLSSNPWGMKNAIHQFGIGEKGRGTKSESGVTFFRGSDFKPIAEEMKGTYKYIEKDVSLNKPKFAEYKEDLLKEYGLQEKKGDVNRDTALKKALLKDGYDGWVLERDIGGVKRTVEIAVFKSMKF